MTVAFEIKRPWRQPPDQLFPEGYRPTWITIWHVDPEKDGTDDSCGWFMRSRHGDKAVLERIVKRFEEDWDRVWVSDSGHTYLSGYFYPVGNGDGSPILSIHGIAINLFFIAALEFFKRNGTVDWDKARRFMQRNLFDILHFAENPTDSLYDGFTRKFAIGCNEAYTQRARDERLRGTASCIYAWILRATRPWYEHPRWHFWHWKIQINRLVDFKRWLFSRCAGCGKRFQFGSSPVTYQWKGTGPRWFRGEHGIYHQNCMPNHTPNDPATKT